MSATRGSSWGPRPLPEFLAEQLDSSGFAPGDAARCAALINGRPSEGDVVSLFVDLGSCKFLEGDIDGAVAAWRHAISSQHDAAAARALLNTGLLYEHVHLTERAIGVLASVNERGWSAYSAPAAMATARCQRSIGDFDGAIETMAHLAEVTMTEQPDSPLLAETFYGLGDAANAASQFDRAETAWRVAASGAPSTVQKAAIDQLVELLLDREKDDDLVDLLERHDELSAHAPRVLDRIDAAYRKADESKAAALIGSLRGHDLVPSDRFRLVDIELELGNVNEAIDELEFLLAHTDVGVQRQSMFLLGEVYRGHEMVDVATSMYERVLDTGDRYWSSKAALALGDVLHGEGDYSVATSYWRQAAESDLTTIRNSAEERLGAIEREVALAADETVDEDHVPPVDASPLPTSPPAAQDPQVVVLSSLEAEQPDSLHDELDRANLDDGDEAEPIVVVLVDNEAQDPALDDAGHGDLVLVDHTESGDLHLIDDVDEPELDLVDLEDLGLDRDDDHGFGALRLVDNDATADPGDIDDVVDTQWVAAESAEPVVVVLSDVEAAEPVVAAEAVEVTEQDAQELPAATSSFFASQLGEAPYENPYAALAPDSLDGDVAPSVRNPYAELAPSFSDDDFQPASDVEPGDWESLLDGWPRHTDEPSSESADDQELTKGSRAFSRYT